MLLVSLLVGCAPPDSLLLVTPTPWATLAPNATSATTGEFPVEVAEASASPSATVPLPTETSMVQNGVYVVQQDDTLWYISAQLGIPIDIILAANPTLDPNLLFPNDTIIIPPYDPEHPELSFPTLPPTATITPTVTLTPTATIIPATQKPNEPTFTPTASPLPTITLTPSATLRPINTPGGPVPSYPYIFNVTERTSEIYAEGKRLGNRANVFSKIGDSITDNTVFLTPFAGSSFNLDEHAYLRPVIEYYQQVPARTDNSFGNDSLAAHGGWSVWHLFNAESSNPDVCQPEEAPLACEYRVVTPAVALIMIGTNDVVTLSVPTYERYMRQVIEMSISMGVIPVISTIPDFTYEEVGSKVLQMNEMIARLAYEYEIPLWDYWAAMQLLPNRGLSVDGIHPSWAIAGDLSPKYVQYGMNTRNLTALQALDVVWRGVLAR
jgi:LysM repeat protein